MHKAIRLRHNDTRQDSIAHPLGASDRTASWRSSINRCTVRYIHCHSDHFTFPEARFGAVIIPRLGVSSTGSSLIGSGLWWSRSAALPSRSADCLEEQWAFFEVCQAFALPDEVVHECVAHIVGQCDEDDDASGGVSGCGNTDDRAVAVDVMAAREPECDTSGRWRTCPAPVARTDKRDPPGPRREC
jgi:hypothetical protein